MTHPRNVILAVTVISILLSACSSRPVRTAVPSPPADTAEGLHLFLQSALAVAKSGDDQKLASLVKEMEIPNYEALVYVNLWTSRLGVRTRLRHQFSRARSLSAASASTTAQRTQDVLVRSVNDAPQAGNPFETGLMNNRQRPINVFFAYYLTSPSAPRPSPIGYFVFVDGKFRWQSGFAVQVPPPGNAQTMPEVQTLALRTATRVAQAAPERVLLATLSGCFIDDAACAALTEAVTRELSGKLPDAVFISPETLTGQLKQHGFIALDAHNAAIVRLLAAQTGAQMLITENAFLQGDGLNLQAVVFDAQQGVALQTLVGRVPRSPQTKRAPLIYVDPESGVGVLVLGPQAGSSSLKLPTCSSCPQPAYTPEARANKIQGAVTLLTTVDAQGRTSDIAVLQSLEKSLDDAALKAAAGWRFNPAIGPDGMPFAIRQAVQVTFKLL